MKKLSLIVLALTLYLGATYGTFKHPGIYTTIEQLEFVKKQIEANKEPWASAYKKLLKSNPTSRKPKGMKIVPGSSSSKGRKDMDAMGLDGSHAFASALLYYFTGEQKYADYSVKVLNEWSIFEKSPMALYATWAVPQFINAAELMKHLPGTRWKESDRKKFDKMVDKYFWKKVQPPATKSGSNHGCTANEAQFAIAIYLDDQKKFDEAVKNYNWQIVRWIFWNNVGRINGETANTCRDLSHTRLTIGILQAAQAAYYQGVDLWKPHKARYAAFAELHAGIMTGMKKAPSNICAYKKGQKGRVFCKGNVFNQDPAKNGFPPCQETAWEILYNHISRRLGVDLPMTKKMTERQRPFGKISTRADKWETLIHANINPDDIKEGVSIKPTISITKPADNSTFKIGTTINVNANAEDDGKITKVIFKINGQEYATEKMSPYTVDWTPEKAGTYKIEAEAYDNDSNRKTSKIINVQIKEDAAGIPTIEMVEGEQAPNVASNLIDGLTDDDSRWSVLGFPKSVIIDYGEIKTIIGTKIYTFKNRSYEYTISISETSDGDYTEVVNQTGESAYSPIEHSFAAVKGRYLKLTVTGVAGYANDWVSINELEIVEKELTPAHFSKTPIDDVYTENGKVYNNKELRVENNNRVRIAYMKYDLSNAEGEVSEASLVLKETAEEAGEGTFKVYLGSDVNWSEKNTKKLPEKGVELGSYKGKVSKGDEFTIKLTDLPIAKSITLIVEMEKAGNDISFISSEGTSKPKLQFSTLKRGMIKKEIEKEFSINIYPNPTEDMLNVYFQGCDNEMYEIKIMTLQGRIISVVHAEGGNVQLDVSGLNIGMYIVEVKSGSKVSTKRFYKR